MHASILRVFLIISLLELNEFLHLLDKRYEEKVKKDGTFMARKERKIGTPSPCEPPVDAPGWTLVSAVSK